MQFPESEEEEPQGAKDARARGELPEVDKEEEAVAETDEYEFQPQVGDLSNLHAYKRGGGGPASALVFPPVFAHRGRNSAAAALGSPCWSCRHVHASLRRAACGCRLLQQSGGNMSTKYR